MKLVPLLASALAASACLAADAGRAADPPKPNFVVILIDDMGYGDIGPFGSKLNRTPNLDRMAAEGMKLTSFYARRSVRRRGPDHDGLLCQAGFLAQRDLPGLPDRSSAKEQTVAELLKPQGYATMAIGKWHLGDRPAFLPIRHGFDHYLGPALLERHGRSGPGRLATAAPQTAP